jgi:hypothetical protein
MTGEDKRIGKPLLVGVAVLGILGAALVTFGDGWNPIALDYGVFWRSIRRPLPLIYQFRAGSVFPYPPTLIPLLKPLTLLSFWSGYFFWTLLSALAFFFAARRLCDTRTAALAMFSSASIQNLLLGQTPMLMAAGFLFALSLQSTLLTGAIIGCLAAIKPQLFLMAPFVALVRRDWRGLTGMAGGGFATVLTTIGLYGAEPWLDWFHDIPWFENAMITFDLPRHMITLTSVGLRLGMNPFPWWLVGTCVALFAVVRLSRRVEGIFLAALITSASAISSPYALVHDLVAAMPAVAALILSGPAVFEALIATTIFAGVFLPFILPGTALAWAWRANGMRLNQSGVTMRLSSPENCNALRKTSAEIRRS